MLSNIASYNALGDSYAAGLGSVDRLANCSDDSHPGSNTCTYGSCNKDNGSYAYLFAQKYNLMDNFGYFACSGANADDVQKKQIASDDFGKTDLVTVQVGGDMSHGFLSVIATCLAFGDFECGAVIDAAYQEMDDLIQQVADTLTALDEKDPASFKALVGYVQFFGFNYDDDCTITTADPTLTIKISSKRQENVNDLIKTANEHLRALATARGYGFVDADGKFDSHRWCDDQEPWWINTNIAKSGVDPSGANYTEKVFGHPTADGQTAYLSALEEALSLHPDF